MWHEGDPLNLVCACASAVGNSTASLAVGDLDGDGIPEIVMPNETAGLIILDSKDGDGFPEIGTAFGLRYVVIDLQAPTVACPAWPNAFDDKVAGLQGNAARAPGLACAMDTDCAAGAVCNTTKGACVCLHNGWQRITEDDSSRVTASSVFDFNGDGAAEVIYDDECDFRIYDGTTSEVLFKHHSPSRTRIEHPVVADVDNDGNNKTMRRRRSTASRSTERLSAKDRD